MSQGVCWPGNMPNPRGWSRDVGQERNRWLEGRVASGVVQAAEPGDREQAIASVNINFS